MESDQVIIQQVHFPTFISLIIDKARFIQANYRFIVRPNGDYRPQCVDPDVPIPWDLILQILASPLTHMMACPICLSEMPVAPRMARCGHIACLPCFIRYFASEDVGTGLRGACLKYRKCPICWDNIQLSEIKPVRWYAIDDGTNKDSVVVATEPREGFDVAMRLFMRKQGTTLSIPRDDYLALSQVAVIPQGDVPWHYIPEILHYSWIVKGSASYMRSEAEREIEDLKRMEKEDEVAFGEDGFWTHKSIQRIHDQADTYGSIDEGPVHEANLAISSTLRADINDLTKDVLYKHQHNSQTRENAYLFYQPRSGSHYYLSSLDIRILRKAFGDYENFPSAILARVEHISSPQTIDDDFRRRVKYLSHLPLGCQVSFLECDWSEIVDRVALEAFSPEIEKRRRQRREKLVKEEKEREIEERKRRLGRRDMHSLHLYQEEEIAESITPNSEDANWVIANAFGSAESGASPTNLSTSLGASPPSDSNIVKTVWGTPRIPSSTGTPVLPKEVDDDDEAGDSGGLWAKNWNEILNSDRTDGSKHSGSRRKKGKRLVLMSNSFHRGT